jgi:hypothetical protein
VEPFERIGSADLLDVDAALDVAWGVYTVGPDVEALKLLTPLVELETEEERGV